MKKLKKNYNGFELLELCKNGNVKRYKAIDTRGTSSMGLLVRFDIKINEVPYQVVYSSKGYANKITSDIVKYNGTMREKHEQYYIKALNHFKTNIMHYITTK